MSVYMPPLGDPSLSALRAMISKRASVHLPFSEVDTSEALCLLERLIARRADELAAEMRDKHNDRMLWTRAEAEILQHHQNVSRAAYFAAGFRPEDDVLRENICR
jgi:hypothetical protein